MWIGCQRRLKSVIVEGKRGALVQTLESARNWDFHNTRPHQGPALTSAVVPAQPRWAPDITAPCNIALQQRRHPKLVCYYRWRTLRRKTRKLISEAGLQ